LNNFVNFELYLTKHSGIDPYEKCIIIPGGHAWQHVFMACSKLEAMTNYVVKQACGNDKLACVYMQDLRKRWLTLRNPFFHYLYI
jgi:hypothetical protein